MKKTLAIVLVMVMSLTAASVGVTVFAQTPEISALPLTQDFDSDIFDTAVPGEGYENVENGNFRTYSNDSGYWKAASDVVGMTGKAGEIKNVTSGKMTVVQRYFTKQTSGKVMLSFDTKVTSGSFHIYMNALTSGINYGSGGSVYDINVLSFDSTSNLSAQSGAYKLAGDGVWVANKVYHVDVLFDIDNNRIYTALDGNTLTIDDVKAAKSGMTSLGSVSFKTMGENSCAYIDNLEVKAIDGSAQVYAGEVELTDGALNVNGIDSVDVKAVGIDEATLSNAKIYDLGTSSIVRRTDEIALTTQSTDDGAKLALARAFESGRFYRLDMTEVKTFYGEPLMAKPIDFKCVDDTTIEINHDFVNRETDSNPANGGLLDTAITAIAPDGKDGIVSVDNVTGNDDISDGYALKLGDYDAAAMSNKSNYRGKYGFTHSLKDENFTIDATKGGKLTIDLKFINETAASYDGRYDLFLAYGGNKQQIFRQYGGNVIITSYEEGTAVDTPYERAYYITADNSAPNALNIVLDFDKNTMTVNFSANRYSEPISTTVDYKFTSSSGLLRDYDGIAVMTGSDATFGGYFDYFNLKYEKSEVGITDTVFKDYRNEKFYAYEGKTIPASTKSMELSFSAALTDEQIDAISVTDADGNPVGTGSYDEVTNKYTVIFDNYLKPSSEYTISVLGETETVVTDEGDFVLLERELTVTDKATLTAKLVNTTGAEKKFMMAVASYENDGLLLNGVNVQEITSTDSRDHTIELGLGAYDKVKGYVWSGIDTMRPLFPSLVYPTAE